MRVRFSALLLLVSLGSVLVTGGSAQAFLPLDARQSPPDFGRLDRARVPDPARQAALTNGKEWARFLAVHPGAWRVTWDDRAGTPRSILGASIPLGLAPSADAKTVEASARALLAQMGPLVGVGNAQLATKTVEKVHDTWFVQFDRVTSNGTPVLGAFASLQIANGDVVALRIETHPSAEVNLPGAKISASGAEAIVAQSLAPWGIANAKSTSRAVIAHVPFAGAWRYVPAFEVETTAGPGNDWISVVDAADGVVLSRESQVRYYTSALTGEVEPRTPVDTKVPLPFAFIDVTTNAVNAVADSTGTFTAAGTSPGSSSVILNGSLATIQNQGGSNGALTFSSTAGGSFDWAAGAGSPAADQPQLDAYHSANVVRIWASHAFINPQDEPSTYSGWLSTPLTYNVNLNQTCNSYWDGSVNLFDADTQCNNTAQLADVVYHETGHGLHNATIVTGVFDGALSEGTADFTSAQITGDSKIGPYFFTNGDPVRDLTTLVVYPQDLTGEVHNDGLTWGGSWWDLRTALLAKYGAAGPAKVADLFVKSLEPGSDLSGAFDAVMQADTVNGSTPDQCEIIGAFAKHGLTSGSNLFALTHTEVASPAAAGQAIAINATTPSSVCPALTVSGVTLFYKVDGGAPQNVNMTLSGTSLSAQIPAQQAGHVVRYWFVESMADGSTVTSPANAPNDEGYGFYVGTLHTIWTDDFETDKGWTHGGTHDDWQRGTPTGSTNDPADAYSGTNVFGNNLSGDYQPDSNEYAVSPVIDTRGVKGARLEFRRWLSVEESTYDHATVEVSNNGGSTWTQLYLNPSNNGASGSFPKDDMWTFEDYDISSVADGHKIQLRFALTSDPGAEYGGWTLDDVSIVSPNAAGSVGGGGKGCGCDLSRGQAQGLGSSLLLGGLALGSLVLRKAKSRRDA